MFNSSRRMHNQLSSRRFAEKREAESIKNKEALLKSIENNDVSVLKKSALKINDQMAWDDDGADGVLTNEDDEYQWAGLENPNVLITSSRDPSSLLKQFCKEIHHLIPNSQRMNRGNTTLEVISEKCMKEQITDLIIIEESRGIPTKLIVVHYPHGPTAMFSLENVVPRHKMNLETDNKGQHKMPTQYPHIFFTGMNTKLGTRVQTMLKHLFPIPKTDSNRLILFADDLEDNIVFRHFTLSIERKKEAVKTQVVQNHGPNFVMRLYKLFRGTLQNESISDIEYELRPYMNTASKRKFLSTE